jgi:hypothetical protein
MKYADSQRLPLSDAATELLVDGMSKAIEIYNAFHTGKYEDQIMLFVAAIKELAAAGFLDSQVVLQLPDGRKFSVPFELVGLMVASTKHMGDLTHGYGKLGKTVFRSRPSTPSRRRRPKH